MTSKEQRLINESDERLKFILSTVEKIRVEKKITPTPGLKPEGSCYAARGGEMGNMFWAQLVLTTDGTGEWRMLDDPDILEGLYDYVSSLNV